MADQFMKSTAQQKERDIASFETKLEQMQNLLAEEHLRIAENMDDMRTQIHQLTSFSLDNNKRFEEMMDNLDFMKKTMKGKHLDLGEGSTVAQGGRDFMARNTGYPPGFIPSTPTNMAVYQEQ